MLDEELLVEIGLEATYRLVRELRDSLCAAGRDELCSYARRVTAEVRKRIRKHKSTEPSPDEVYLEIIRFCYRKARGEEVELDEELRKVFRKLGINTEKLCEQVVKHGNRKYLYYFLLKWLRGE